MDDGEELELGDGYGGETNHHVVQEMKEYDGRPFSSVQWDRRRYLGALIGKSAKAARGAYEYMHGHEGGLGHVVEGLEGDE